MRAIDGQLVPDPAEVPVVRELVEAFVTAGGRMKTVAALLNARGHRTRRGPWSDTAVNRVLRNAQLRELLSKDLWARCEALLAERVADGDGPVRRPAHPLGGVVECRCGRRMNVRGAGATGKYVCRGCRARIAADTLDRLFLKSLASVQIDAAEIVAALAGNPRAAEITRMLGGQSVPLSEVWPALDTPRRQQLVDLLVARIVVGSDEISVVLAENDDSEGKPHSSTPNSLPTSHGSEPVAPEASSPERRPPPRLEDLPELLSVGEVAAVLRLSKSKTYELIASRQLPAHRPGGRLRITAKAVREFLRDSRLERNPVR
jgi:excisionase family DNA binding protein